MAGTMHDPTTRTEVQSGTRSSQGRTRLLTLVLTLLAVITLIHFIAVTHTAYPTVVTANCLDLVRNSDYTKLVPFHPPSQQMNAVQFVNELTGGQPSALVEVTATSPQQLMDVYIYGCTLLQNNARPTPTPVLTLLFKQQGLQQGTVTITPAHTLSISRLDTTISAAEDTLLQPLEQNIYREYAWRNGRFVAKLFPGLYPVMSYNEASALQDQANSGQALPWNDPQNTCIQMAQDLFHWSTDQIHTSIVQANAITAHVLLQRTQSNLSITVTLTRLVQHNNQGIWIVTDARTPGMSLDATALPIPASSPLTLHGIAAQGNSQNSTITSTLFDHTFKTINILSSQLQEQHDGTFSGSITYTNAVSDQPGLLLLQAASGDSANGAQKLLLTNLLLG